MPVCTCSLHATCLDIFLIARLGLEACYCFLLGVGLFLLGLVCLFETLRIILHGIYLPQCLAAHVRYIYYI